MGGRGAYLKGYFSVPKGWDVVDYVNGIKVLKPMDATKSFSLPYKSTYPNAKFALFGKDGHFKQLRKYGDDMLPRWDIEIHVIDGKYQLHKHIFTNGVRQETHLNLTLAEKTLYKNLLSR